ncbi:hypothetical protein PspLS_10833 [Pyricularia sp. CBS 133598]|nr:hypothetical protein PspLS_10833 [Pyricularia sp. CBS 133598]
MTSEDKPLENNDSEKNLVQVRDDKWSIALGRLSIGDRERFEVSAVGNRSPQDILADVLAETRAKKDECMRKRWKTTVKGRTIILRDVLEKITVWVNKFAEVGPIIASCDPVAGGLPWAAIRFILKAAVNDVEIFGFVLQSVESISNTLASAAIFEVLYLDQAPHKFAVSERLSECVVALYAAILQYLSATLRYYSQHTATRLVKSLGSAKSDFEEKYKPVSLAKGELEELVRLAEAEKTSWVLDKVGRAETERQVQHRVLSQLLHNLQQPIDRISSQLDVIHDGLERETRIKILRSISSIPYLTHHKAARKGRLEGSGQWLLGNKSFQSWRSESTSSVLWLHGIPGSGKTKLASLVVDELTDSENLAYFYCMRNPAEPLRGQCDAILSSLVRQLASTSTDSSVLAPITDTYQDALDGMTGFEDFAWTSDESSSILLELLKEYPAVTMVFDALDEVNPEDRQELMDILSELLRESPNLLKIFVSSRENYDIALHFEGSPNIYIDAQDNKGDIESFIDDRLSAAKLLRGRLTDTLRSTIASTLLDKAHGMFRWVDLQIQSLRPLKVPADIEARLGALPATLEESYWGIYQDILASGEHATDLAVFTFQWVMYAKSGISADRFASFASCALSSESVTQAFTETEIIDVCTNLVINRTGVLEFAHLSVREFLEGLPKRSVETFVPDISHGRIATACLKFLGIAFDELDESCLKLALEQPEEERKEDENKAATVDDKTIQPNEEIIISQDTTSDFQDDLKKPREESPKITQEITKTDWEPENVIVRRTGSDGEADPADEYMETNTQPELFSKSDRQMVEYTSRYWPEHATESGSHRTQDPLQTLIRRFLIDVESKLVSRQFRIWCWMMQNNSRYPLPRFGTGDSIGHTYLYYACKSPCNPIWLASFYSWLDEVEYIYEADFQGLEEPRELRLSDLKLASNISTNEYATEELSPLVYAVAKGNFALAECIVNSAPDLLQTKSTLRSEPLVRAAEDGDERLVTLLLNKPHGGLDAEKDALIGAIRSGKPETCRACLDFNPQLLSSSGTLAFITACKLGNLETVVLLLDRGVSTEKAAEGLNIAVLREESEMVAEFLKRGLGKNAMSKALIIAVSNGDTKTTTLLLNAGAEKEPAAVLRATRDDTPLTAIRLIQDGFPATGRWGRTGRSPLHYASLNGRDKVVLALIGAGVVIDAYDSQGQTPLHLAARVGSAECTRILLDKGADVLAEDEEGKIPLDLAEDSGDESCVTVIRERMELLMENLLRAKAGQEAQVATIGILEPASCMK